MASNQQSQSLLLKAREASQQYKIDLAINFYEQFLKKNKHADDIRYELATFLAVNKRSKEAIATFKILLKSNNQNPFLYANLGTAHAESGQPENALNYFRRALEIKPSLIELYIPMAECNRRLKKFDLALDLLKQYLNLQPMHHGAYCIMGLIYLDINELPKSLECFERATDIAPQIAEYRIHFSKVLIEVGFNTEAKNQINEALKINPDSIEIKYLLINVLDRSHNFFEAIDNLKIWTNLYPEDLKIHELICGLYIKVNYITQAKLHLDLLIKAKPNNIDIKIYQIKILEKNHQLIEARQLRNELLKQHGKEDAVLEYAREKNLLGQIDPKIIQENFNSSKEVSVKDKIKRNFLLGEFYDARNEWDKAFEYFSIANEIKNAYYEPHIEEFFLQKESEISCIDKEFSLHKAHNISAIVSKIEPIFIVGMSRAGKTWLENLLSKTQAIISADEIKLQFHKPEEILKKIRSNSEFNQESELEDLNLVRDKYLREIERYAEGKGAKYVISTLPAHGFSLGQIHQLFPRAPIIFSQRDPLDIVIFNFFKMYRHDTVYAYNLGYIARYYQIYKRMMDVWIEKLPKKIIQFKFENSVNNPIESFEKLLSLIEIKADISNELKIELLGEANQYKRSVGHWKNYEKFLGDIVKLKLQI